jgi:hypothetical protein
MPISEAAMMRRDARMFAKPSSNYKFWDAAEEDVLEAYLNRFHQLAATKVANGENRKVFLENWENATSAARYAAGRLRSQNEPMVEDGRLKLAMLEGRVVRSYDDAPAVLALGSKPIPVPSVVVAVSRFASSTHARKWIFGGSELERMRAGCPLATGDRHAVERFTFDTMKTVGAALEWHITTVLDAVTYARRFWLRKWACPRLRLLPHNPRILVAACLLIAAKVEGANTKVGKTRKEDVALLLGRIIKAMRDIDDIWVVQEKAVLGFDVELLLALRFELVVHHPHTSLKRVMGAMATSVAQTAWSLVTELYSSDLVFLHAPSDLAHAALVVAASHHHAAAVAFVATNETTGQAAVSAVVSWVANERMSRRHTAGEKPEESPSSCNGDMKVQQQHRHAIACLLQLAHGSSTIQCRKRSHCVI